jgi:trehalose 6-phosphate phosphatase
MSQILPHADTLPPLPGQDAALFLDLDGTLIEIAARPDAVVVPPHLPALLGRLSAGLGGAVAVVTGRGLAVAQALTRAPGLAFACEHGGVIEASVLGIPPQPEPLGPPEAWRAAAADFVATRPGMLLEEKNYGFVLHFRQAPEQAEAATAFLRGMVADSNFQVVPAHAAAELRPRGSDKGSAVDWLMRHPPFAGRVPLFLGDDVTDEDGMRVCRRLGGEGYRVPERFPAGPADVLAWLDALAARLEA